MPPVALSTRVGCVAVSSNRKTNLSSRRPIQDRHFGLPSQLGIHRSVLQSVCMPSQLLASPQLLAAATFNGWPCLSQLFLWRGLPPCLPVTGQGVISSLLWPVSLRWFSGCC